MANEILVKGGTAKVFKASGGDAAITLASLATTKARQSVKLDLGATRADEYAVLAELETGGAAPTAATVIELWWSPSPNATAGNQNAGGASGADAAYKDAEEAEWKQQLTFIGALVLTNDASTIQRQSFMFRPAERYGSLVVVNLSGQTLETDDNEHRVTFTPRILEVQ
jgi:hypothetical protein